MYCEVVAALVNTGVHVALTQVLDAERIQVGSGEVDMAFFTVLVPHARIFHGLLDAGAQEVRRRIHAVGVGVGSKDRSEVLAADVGLPVAALSFNDGNVLIAVFLDGSLQALFSVVGVLVGLVAVAVDDLHGLNAVFLHNVEQVDHAPVGLIFGSEVNGQIGDFVTLCVVGNLTAVGDVDEAGVMDFLDGGQDGLRVEAGAEDDFTALRDQVTDVVGLFGNVVVCVGDDKLNLVAALCCFVVQSVLQIVSPGVESRSLKALHGQAHLDMLEFTGLLYRGSIGDVLLRRAGTALLGNALVGTTGGCLLAACTECK